MPKISGFVFYRGPSQLDGKPIVAILTGLKTKSRNHKTGHLLQTWILRSDMNPLEAARLGADSSICGSCRHRGEIIYETKTNKRTGKKIRRKKNVKRSCYVRLDTAPNNIYKTYKRGRYPEITPEQARVLIGDSLSRGGSYGDPTAVPYAVWLAFGLDNGTAYTHQWRRFPQFASFCMASVDSPFERSEAALMGFRTFRVRTPGQPLEAYERPCPASKEANYKTSCALCRACGGLGSKAKVDMAIIAHSAKATHFNAAAK